MSDNTFELRPMEAGVWSVYTVTPYGGRHVGYVTELNGVFYLFDRGDVLCGRFTDPRSLARDYVQKIK